jgi:hypothetical protein
MVKIVPRKKFLVGGKAYEPPKDPCDDHSVCVALPLAIVKELVKSGKAIPAFKDDSLKLKSKTGINVRSFFGHEPVVELEPYEKPKLRRRRKKRVDDALS